jgi:ferredoxin-nitrite reductase
VTSVVGTTKTLNKIERFKAEKDGLEIKHELEQFAQIGWEAMTEEDRNYRLKWLGVFFRPTTPGKFMLRLRLPNGVVNAPQLRTLAEVVQRYGDEGSADITTRQNIQLRGIRLEDVPDIFRRLDAVGLTSIQSGMDNVRNITGSPVAGLDADELIDTRSLVLALQDMITNRGQGNAEFTNLPRKFNIAVEGSRDNSVHAEINDIAYVPAYKNGALGFNVVVGGFFSASRVEAAIPMDVWVSPEGVVPLSRAILEVFRDHGPRANRQKSRLMWLIDEWGIETFRDAVEQQVGRSLRRAAEQDALCWDKRDHLGIYPQKQAGFNYVGLHIPVGRLWADDLFELSRLAEVYGSGELRLTVEQNVILTFVAEGSLVALQQEPLLQKFSPNPSLLERSLVSCTGSQFCNFALIETKQQAVSLARELDAEITLTQPVRIHWTGCPNSCGQPQVADIGFMGTKARKDGKVVGGVDVFTGGKVGKDAHLGKKTHKGVACDDLKPFLRRMLVEDFGATLKPGVVLDEPSSIAAPTGSAAAGMVGQAPATPAAPAIVTFARSGKEVTCTDADYLLEVAERAGIPLASSCQSGNCGTCKQRLLEGQVKYDEPHAALSAEEHAAGVVLTCVGHPVGRIVLDV